MDSKQARALIDAIHPPDPSIEDLLAKEEEPVPEHVDLARRALEAAENNPNAGEMLALAHMNGKGNRLLSSEAEEGEAETGAEPNFDGGAREPAPAPATPGLDHDQLVVQIAQRQNGGGF